MNPLELSSPSYSHETLGDKFLNLCKKFPPEDLAWLLTPNSNVFFFALRTAAAMCISLGIAFWMELDQPGWAPLTVGAVAQLSRGESISKSRWRLMGTLIGSVAALSFTALIPQHPWMFFPVIATWIGACVFFGTINDSFRRYACVLAGYTCAIISFGAAPDGNRVFDLTMGRGTYIVLGIVCETTLSSIFDGNIAAEAQEKLLAGMKSVMLSSFETLKDAIQLKGDVASSVRQQLSTVLALDGKIEFLGIEMGPYSHMSAHAGATLSAISVMVTRSFALSLQLKSFNKVCPTYNKLEEIVLAFLEKLPDRITKQDNISQTLIELQRIREICRKLSLPHSPSDKDSQLFISDAPKTLHERMIYVVLGELMGDLENTLWQYQAATENLYGDTFKFTRQHFKDYKLAFNNAIRAFSAVILTAFWFEITAWNEGYETLSFAALSAGLFGPADDPLVGSFNFLKGALFAWLAGFFLVLVWQPTVTIFEPLIIIFGFTCFVGGLAIGCPKLVASSAAFRLLLPAMLGYQNHHIYDEVSFWNNDWGIVSGIFFTVITYRTVLPFNSLAECRRIRKSFLKGVRELANPLKKVSINDWVSHTGERAFILQKRAASHPEDVPYLETYARGTLSTLALGLNIIRLHDILDRQYLPEGAKRSIFHTLQHFEVITTSIKPAKQAVIAAMHALEKLDTQTLSTLVHVELTKAIANLAMVHQSLRDENGFLTDEVIESDEEMAKHTA